MKKILFCAGILALAASCAENEIDSISGQKEATKGISFGVRTFHGSNFIR